MRTGVLAALALCALTAPLSATAARAAIPCDSSILVATADLTLQDDYVTSSATNPCFILQNGKDVSLNGKTIHCLAPTCATAVRMDTDIAPSVVKTAGTILGPFTIGVDGLNVTSGANITVKDVTIDGARTGVRSVKIVQNVEIILPVSPSGTGVTNAETAQGCTISSHAPPGTHTGIFGTPLATGNTILGLETGIAFVNKASGNVIQSAAECIGIRWYPAVVTDYARDNYIRCPGPASTGITVYSAYHSTDEGPELESNLIRIEGVGISGLVGKAHVFKNLFAVNGASTPITETPSSDLTVETNNLCDDPLYCTWPPLTPFSL